MVHEDTAILTELLVFEKNHQQISNIDDDYIKAAVYTDLKNRKFDVKKLSKELVDWVKNSENNVIGLILDFNLEHWLEQYKNLDGDSKILCDSLFHQFKEIIKIKCNNKINEFVLM